MELDYGPQISYRGEESGSADAPIQINEKPTSFFSPWFEGQVFSGLGSPLPSLET